MTILSCKSPPPEDIASRLCYFKKKDDQNIPICDIAKHDPARISQEEVLQFMLSLTKNNKEAAKRNRCSVLASFCSFTISTGCPDLSNPCNTAVIKKIFRRSQVTKWSIVD